MGPGPLDLKSVSRRAPFSAKDVPPLDPLA
jgi:hypothetical protein